jgi:hypothetical protein
MSKPAFKEPWINDISVTKSVDYQRRMEMLKAEADEANEEVGEHSGKEPSSEGTGIDGDGRRREETRRAPDSERGEGDRGSASEPAESAADGRGDGSAPA